MGSNNSSSKKEKPVKPDGSGSSWSFINFILIILFVGFAFYFLRNTQTSKEITWKEFSELVAKKKIAKVVIKNNESAEVYLKDSVKSTSVKDKIKSQEAAYYFNIGTSEVFNEKLNHLEGDIPEKEKIQVEYEAKKNNFIWFILLLILPFVLFLFVGKWMSKKMGGGMGGKNIFSFGQSGAKMFQRDKNTQITFDDVAGLDEAKQEMIEIVDFLKNPQMYIKLGAKIPKGILLIGPPGTGKTLLAKAVAGEAQVSFLSLSGSEFVEMFVGVGASRVRDLFKKAQEKSPCIVFIDEIDAIGRSRGNVQSFGVNDERESTLNQMLTEMDGFRANAGVIVLAATNRGDVLDRALLRPGRFDRHIYLELPDLREREEIFKVHMRPLIVNSKVDVGLLASQTPGFSGADIANVCNEAALLAARRKKTEIGDIEFSDAVERIVGGMEKRKKIVSSRERKIVAVHEAGHALATCYIKGLKDIVKISIIPRGKSLGASLFRPEELQLISTTQFVNELCILLAGRAAEEVVFGEITSGALDDLEKATKQAYGMVAYYGLGKNIGNLSYFDSSGNQENSFQKPYSEETARLIDEEVIKLIYDSYEKVKKIFLEHKNELQEMGDLLLEKEVIYRDDIEKIVKLK